MNFELPKKMFLHCAASPQGFKVLAKNWQAVTPNQVDKFDTTLTSCAQADCLQCVCGCDLSSIGALAKLQPNQHGLS